VLNLKTLKRKKNHPLASTLMRLPKAESSS